MSRKVPSGMIEKANQHSRRLRELLHAPEILVMPGAYDTLSALLFEALGFQAIQGTSGGIAAVLGYQDGEIVPRADVVEVYRRMVEAVQVPVNADGEKGYGGPVEVAETVEQLVRAGVAGMNLEDSAAHRSGEAVALLPIPEQLAKIGALIETRRSLGSEFFLNARVDSFLTHASAPDKLSDGIARGNAYAQYGADCIFYIGLSDVSAIQTAVKEVQAPVSILANAACPPISVLEDLGVARVSYGVAFTRLALTPVKQLAQVLLAKGDPAPLLDQALPRDEFQRLLRTGLSR